MRLLTAAEFSTKYIIKVFRICQEGKENNVVTVFYGLFLCSDAAAGAADDRSNQKE